MHECGSANGAEQHLQAPAVSHTLPLPLSPSLFPSLHILSTHFALRVNSFLCSALLHRLPPFNSFAICLLHIFTLCTPLSHAFSAPAYRIQCLLFVYLRLAVCQMNYLHSFRAQSATNDKAFCLACTSFSFFAIFLHFSRIFPMHVLPG